MNLSLPHADLATYYARQLNNVFPDNDPIDSVDISSILDSALDRLSFCFKHVAFNRYNVEGETRYDHLYADHNLILNWFLSNEAFITGNIKLANKMYYLNKVMHSFDCMFNTILPKVFLVFHGAGTMLGKAVYNDFFVALQGCTVGSHRGEYPVFGTGVALTANSSVIGKCVLGSRVSISTRTTVFQKDVADDTVIYTDFSTGVLNQKPSSVCYAQQFFNVDLKTFTL